MMKLICFLTISYCLIACTGPGPVLPQNFTPLIVQKIHYQNSYGGKRQGTIKVLKVKPLGEFNVSRIRRVHRRFDFLVEVQFNQNCLQLGYTCIKLIDAKEIKNRAYFKLRRESERDTFIRYLSYLKTSEGWILSDNAFIKKIETRTFQQLH